MPTAVQAGRPRLEAVAEAVPPGSRVADVGSDHGRLPRLLVASGRAVLCVATEFGDGPAGRLRAAVRDAPEAERIEVRQGDGLTPLRAADRLDVLVLAGMGGPTMLSILERGSLADLGVTRLVLQPQSGWGRLREGLERLGRGVVRERLVRDRERFYTVMTSFEGAVTPPPPDGIDPDAWWEIGPCWWREGDPLAHEYWTERRGHAADRLDRAREGGVGPAAAELALADRALELFARSRSAGGC